MAGFCVDPRPGALVSLYGYGDIAGSWYSEPSPFYLSQPRISTESAYQVVGSDTVAETAPDQERWRFYLYCRQRGIWIQEVTGLDPLTDSVSLRAYRPIRNVSRDYPATLLIHGTDDTDVPYQQSADMASAIQAKGRAVELMPIPGGAHAFDEAITASDLARDAPSPAAQSFQRILRFLGKWLN
jgi:acetyl esterase/lipase